jgi:hypothetical protein
MTNSTQDTKKTGSAAPKKMLGAAKKPRAAAKKRGGPRGPSKAEKLTKAAINEVLAKFNNTFTPEQINRLGLAYLAAMCENLFPMVVDDMVKARAAAAAAPAAPPGFNPAEPEAEPEPTEPTEEVEEAEEAEEAEAEPEEEEEEAETESD